MASMGKIPFRGFGKVEISAAGDSVTALPFPPVFVGAIESVWNTGKSTPGEFDFELFAAAATEITAAELFGVVQEQVEIATDTVTVVTNATDTITAPTHGLLNGHGPIQFTGTDLPDGLLESTDYYVIYVDGDNFKAAASLQDAVEGTPVALADDGSGTITFVGSESGDFLAGSNNSYEIKWLSYGFLGPAADGAISITSALEGYADRVFHRPRTVLYGVVGTLSVATALSMSMYPVRDAHSWPR